MRKKTFQCLGSFVRTSLLLAVGAMTAQQVVAAERVNVRGVDHAALRSASSAVNGGGASVPSLQQMLALDPRNNFQVLRKNSDPSGKTHTRYEQKFHGIPVYGEQVIVHGDAQGNVQSLTGVAIGGIENDISDNDAAAQQFSSHEAMLKAKNNLHRYLKVRDGVVPSFRGEKIKLVIYLDAKDVAHDAWYISYVAEADGVSPVRPYFILDADDGRILKTWNGMAHVEVGTGPGGNEKTGQIEYGSSGVPFLDVAQAGGTCTMQTPKVRTVNLGGSTSDSYQTAYSYACPRNTFQSINGGYAPLNDAHFYAVKTNAMYESYVGASPLSGMFIVRVHYGVDYENAFWDGTFTSFGDGKDFFLPMSTSLNVVAHEASHGNVEQNSGLEYVDQSGGINEAYADIAGETAEYFIKGQVDWLVGADVMKGKTKALRYFEDPRKDKKSIRSAADYYDGLNVHYSSGVFNRAFFLLANTPGWTVDKAFKVFYFANVNYWTPLSNYVDAACGVISAADDLSFNTAEVNTAFQTVGVNCPAPVVDTDGDHMDDAWETAHGLSVGVNDSAGDSDGDSMTNLQEFLAGTNPQSADTDSDGMVDLYDPLPTDGDWLNFISKSAMMAKDDVKGAQAGFSVAAGDFDNDGFADTVIGAPYYDYRYGKSRYPDIGLVVVVSGQTGKAIWFNIGEVKGQLYGWSVANAGDLDSDGIDDLVVGAPGTVIDWNAYRLVKKGGRVAAYNAFDMDVNGWPAAIFEEQGSSAGVQFGYSVTGVGDLYGNGYGVIAVGAPGTATTDGIKTFKGAGAVYVYRPWTGSQIADYYGDSTGDAFGATVAGIGDISGDGKGDLAVGAPLYDRGNLKDAGSVYLMTPINDGWFNFFLRGIEKGGRFGASVAGGGDISGDGIADFVVGVPFADKKKGGFVVFRGIGSIASVSTGFQVSGIDTNGLMGSSLAIVSDVNNDNCDDILVGSPGVSTASGKASGRAQLFSGGSGTELWFMDGKAIKDNFGSAVASGDVNGDGKGDFIIGARMHSAVGGTQGKPKLIKGAGSVSVINGAAAL